MVARLQFIVLLRQRSFVWSKDDHTHQAISTNYNLINKAATSCGQNLSQHWIWITFLVGALCKQSSAVDQIIDYSFFIKLYLIASGKGDIKTVERRIQRDEILFDLSNCITKVAT